MIQRKQTLFFLLAGLLALSCLFLPLFQSGEVLLNGLSQPVLMVLSILSLLLAIVAIFLYTDRVKQILIGRVNLVMLLGLMGAIFYYEYGDGVISFVMGICSPVIAIFSNILGIRGVQSDQKLIRDMDRLR